MEQYMNSVKKWRPILAICIVVLTLIIAVCLQSKPAQIGAGTGGTNSQPALTSQGTVTDRQVGVTGEAATKSDETEKNKEEVQLRANMISNARGLYENGQYAEAIAAVTAVEREFGSDEELSSLYEDCAGTYRELLKAEAKAAYSSDGLEAAVQVLKGGDRVLPNDSELQGMLETLEKCTPVSFGQLETRRRTYNLVIEAYADYLEEGKISIRDASAVEHTESCIQFEHIYDTGFITKYTNGTYTNFSGEFLLSRTESDEVVGTLKVFADDKEVFSSGRISRKTMPVTFDVDITNAQELKVVFLTNYSGSNGYVFNPVVYVRPESLLDW